MRSERKMQTEVSSSSAITKFRTQTDRTSRFSEEQPTDQASNLTQGFCLGSRSLNSGIQNKEACTSVSMPTKNKPQQRPQTQTSQHLGATQTHGFPTQVLDQPGWQVNSASNPCHSTAHETIQHWLGTKARGAHAAHRTQPSPCVLSPQSEKT